MFFFGELNGIQLRNNNGADLPEKASIFATENGVYTPTLENTENSGSVGHKKSQELMQKFQTK